MGVAISGTIKAALATMAGADPVHVLWAVFIAVAVWVALVTR